jgi:hypothetical protein
MIVLLRNVGADLKVRSEARCGRSAVSTLDRPAAHASGEPSTAHAPRATTPPLAATESHDGKYSSRAALARGPLGVIVALFALTQGGLGLATQSPKLSATAATLLVAAMVVLALIALVGFLYVWVRRPAALFPPDMFPDRGDYLRGIGVGPADIVPSKPAVIGEPKPQPVELPSVVLSKPAVIGELKPQPAAAELPSADAAWLASEAGGLQRGFPTSTGLKDLTRELAGSPEWKYLLVDVGNGDRWLASRLFGYVTMYTTQRPLPCIVFVGARRLIGIAEPARLCGAMARLFPWFNQTLAGLLAEKNIPVFGATTVDEDTAVTLLTDFIARLQDFNNHDGDSEWSPLPQGRWEHTRWLDEAMLRNELNSALLDTVQSRLRRPGNAPADETMLVEIMRRDTRFVAVVGDDDVLLNLYDRRQTFERWRERIAAMPAVA